MATQQQHSNCQCNGENVRDADVKRASFPVGRMTETGVVFCGRDVFSRRHKGGGRAAALVENPNGDRQAINTTAVHVVAGAAYGKLRTRGHAKYLRVGYPARRLARLITNKNSGTVSACAKTGACDREHAAAVAGADAGCD